jgi:phosphopantothenate---cysteine ligase (ATP)
MLKIDFVTVAEYLFLLRSVTRQMAAAGCRSMFYLAAAVSDFYIPEEKMVSSANLGVTF